MNEKELADWVAQQRGKVVLIDCWATWCATCRIDFPHTVDLHRKFAEQGLVVASLSFDDEDAREAAITFLRDQQATFDNFRSCYDNPMKGSDAFGIKTGAVPYYFLYDRRGKRRDDLDTGERNEGLKPEDLTRGVETLLADEKE